MTSFAKFKFHLLLIIAFSGICLRFIDYDKIPPFGETMDEFAYTWAGMSFLQTGIPSSWSWMTSYQNRVSKNFFGIDFPIVSPWLDAPPLYQFVSGGVALLFGENQFSEVRLSTIRLTPLILSFFSIILTGYFAKNVFDKQIALMATLLYATTPSIILSNRLSVTENLLTPISLATLLIFTLNKKGFWNKLKPYLIGLFCGLALLTKNIGVTLLITTSYLFFLEKRWKSLLTILLISILFSSIYVVIGYKFGFHFFFSLLKDLRTWHSEKYPEAMLSIFRFPTVTNKHTLFFDGIIFSGFIILLSAPLSLWYKNLKNMQKNLILLFPYSYILLLILLVSGGNDGIKWYGWYLFPLFPFIVILLAFCFYNLYLKPRFFVTIFFLLTLGLLSLRFLLILVPNLQNYWQFILTFVLSLIVISFLTKNLKFQRFILVTIFFVILIINILVAINFGLFYSPRSQPF